MTASPSVHRNSLPNMAKWYLFQAGERLVALLYISYGHTPLEISKDIHRRHGSIFTEEFCVRKTFWWTSS